jgi:fructose-specific phosphotransferase system IIC component
MTLDAEVTHFKGVARFLASWIILWINSTLAPVVMRGILVATWKPALGPLLVGLLFSLYALSPVLGWVAQSLLLTYVLIRRGARRAVPAAANERCGSVEPSR